MVDDMQRKSREERSNTQMTLGELIATLEQMDGDTNIEELYEPHSYRGYYTDLGFETTGAVVQVRELLKTVKKCLGQTFEGYKGGDYTMTKTTPVWTSEYGTSNGSEKIMGIKERGSIGMGFETKEEEY